MAAPLIMAGLSLLPKIPAMWDAVAGLFGKKVPKSVEGAGNLASEVMDAFRKGRLSPEAQIKLKELILQHEAEMAKLAFEEKKLEFEKEKLLHEDLSDVRDLEKESYKSEDQYVRRTRPMILRRLFGICTIYVFLAPAGVILGHEAGLDAETLKATVSMLEWCAGWLFGTFSTAYLGYAAARTVDKKNPEFKNGNGMLNKMVNMTLRGGTKRK